MAIPTDRLVGKDSPLTIKASCINKLQAVSALLRQPETAPPIDFGVSWIIIGAYGTEARLLISVQELELHRVVISKVYASGSLDYHGAEFRQLGDLAVNAVAELVGGEIRVRGRVETRVAADCDRCLGPVEIPVARDFDLFYRPLETIAREEEIEVPADELNVGFYSGEGIALADLVTEQVILSMPMKVICRPDCRGLCPVCGADLNRTSCNCPKGRGDSPFAALLE